MNDCIFIDWLTITQSHTQPQPSCVGGETVYYDAAGNERSSKLHSARFSGSYSSSVSLRSDGTRVLADGNFGRYKREDNLFNHDFEGTVRRCNDLAMAQGISPFSRGERVPTIEGRSCWTGASILRLDVTCNYATGSDAAARDYMRWLSRQSRSRIKKGTAGDESVTWFNTRETLKAYNKAAELAAHGKSGTLAYDYCMDMGIVRIELALRKKLLHDLGIYWYGDTTMEKIVNIFKDRTEVTRRFDRSCDDDVIESVPMKHRAVAAAWIRGQDVRDIVSRASFYRHLKALRAYGLDISEARPALPLPVRVREITFQPVAMPDWYRLEAA